MTVEADIFAALKSLVPDGSGKFRVYPDVAPAGTARPYITFQQVGGVAVNMLDGAAPGKRNGRFQVNCWADTRAAAATLSRQVEDALRAATALQVTVLGAPVSVYEEDVPLYGTRQDFSLWFTS